MQLRNENRPLENQTLGDLFGKLASDTSNLVRQEVALAKVELTQSPGRLKECCQSSYRWSYRLCRPPRNSRVSDYVARPGSARMECCAPGGFTDRGHRLVAGG